VTQAPPRFTTERLEGRRVGSDDEDFLVATWSDPRVHAWLGGPRDRGQVQRTVAVWGALWRDRGFGPWILRDRADAAPVGWVLLHPMDFGGERGIEIGWTIAADRWRQGLASEAAARVVGIGFTECGLDTIVSGTMTENVASRGVMERLGFAFDRAVEHAGLPHVVYRLDRTTWEQHRDG
jgi:RimJ/RimL family protein N-acetyltransferase